MERYKQEDIPKVTMTENERRMTQRFREQVLTILEERCLGTDMLSDVIIGLLEAV